MSELLNDIQKHYKTIDDFNQEVLKNIDKNNKELTDNLLKLLENASKPFASLLNPTKPGAYNPYSD